MTPPREHTPWRLKVIETKKTDGRPDKAALLIDATNLCISGPMDTDRAAFIVEACNNYDRLNLSLKQSEAHREQMSKEICEDGVKLEKLRDENARLKRDREELLEALKNLRSDLAYVLSNSGQSHITNVVKLSVKYVDKIMQSQAQDGKEEKR